MPCDSQCCPDTAQLCVDASFFVPNMLNEDPTAQYIDFYTVSNDKDGLIKEQEFKPDTLQKQFSTVVTTNHHVDIVVNATTVAKKKTLARVTFPIKVDGINEKITIEDPSIVGYDVLFSDTDTFNNENVVNPKTLRMLKLAGRVTIDRASDYLDNQLSEQQSNLKYDISFAGIRVFKLLIMFGKDGNDNLNILRWTDFSSSVLSLKDEKGIKAKFLNIAANENVPGGNKFFTNANSVNPDIDEDIALPFMNTSGLSIDNQEQDIAAASLCLQLRANKNVLNAEADNADPESYPDGDYDVCLTYKDCEGNFENSHVFRITIRNGQITAKWGKDTNKYNVVIAAPHDLAKLKKVNVSVCGSIAGVFNNTNDFVMCIENVMQTTSLIDASGLIVPKTDSSLKPYSYAEVEWNENFEEQYRIATLANSKLYLSVKYVSIVDEQTQDAQRPHQVCPGTLNPWSNGAIKSNGYVTIRGFVIAEITNMMDHPLMSSKLSREVTLCLSAGDIRDQA